MPSGEPALALPVGSLSADDATQVFARFEETAVINLAGLPPLEEVEAETVDDAPVPSPSADDDSIVDAEILEDEPDIPAYVEAASAQPWELPAPYEPHSPGADWTVPVTLRVSPSIRSRIVRRSVAPDDATSATTRFPSSPETAPL